MRQHDLREAVLSEGHPRSIQSFADTISVQYEVVSRGEIHVFNAEVLVLDDAKDASRWLKVLRRT